MDLKGRGEMKKKEKFNNENKDTKITHFRSLIKKTFFRNKYVRIKIRDQRKCMIRTNNVRRCRNNVQFQNYSY